jgi:glycerol kinase
MKQDYILAIDQGTTSSRAIVFDTKMRIVSLSQEEFKQIYPADGWVEHDPEDIWDTTLRTAKAAFDEAEEQGGRVAAIGITNQRETTILWERKTGRAIHNAIVWQDRRTADVCEGLARENVGDEVQQRTGLLLDPYFSATKIAWMLDHVDGARKRAENGDLAFGTVDSFLISRLTGNRAHVTDVTNAARTCLFNIRTQSWDDALLDIFNVPRAVLPRVLDCVDDFGETAPDIFGRALPIFGVAGDQQAATIGQACFNPGDIKSTYGTGCFVLMNTGKDLLISKNRLLSTIAYRLDGKTTYALEGSIFIAGAAMQWLRDGLGIIASAGASEAMAKALPGNNGVYMVPAFTGLGAPYWRPNARGAIFGLTRSTGPAEFVRAALESVCYQTWDLFAAMAADGVNPSSLRIDGGMTTNDWMAQFLADILDLPVDRPEIMETTALGAACLAGLRAGSIGSLEAFSENCRMAAHFEPKIPASDRKRLLAGWHDAVDRVIADGSARS